MMQIAIFHEGALTFGVSGRWQVCPGVQMARSVCTRRSPLQGSEAYRSAGRRAFFLTFSITQHFVIRLST
jgi:hypothetical protein